MSIRCKLSTILGEKKMKMKTLSNLTGISTVTISTLYHETNTGINYDTINKICKALNCTVGDLLIYEPDEE